MSTLAPWTFVPPTPVLPLLANTSMVQLNDTNLWYATFGPPLHVSPQPPVLFLHGGHLSSRWFSHQLAHVSLLSSPYTSIALDTRGHGRSTSSLLEPLSYSLLAQDVIALFNHLDIPKVSVVGWSDGGCTALALAMKHSTRVDRVFAFGANYNPDNGDYESIANSTTFPEVYARVMPEYKEINPKGDYEKLAAQLKHMQASLNWNRQDFAAIPTSESVGEKGKGNWPLVWIAQGDREEAIKREAAVQMHDWILGSALVILPHVGHFAPLQDPGTFNALLERFLDAKKW